MIARLAIGTLMMVTGWVVVPIALDGSVPAWMRAVVVVAAAWVVVVDARLVTVAQERSERRSERLRRRWVEARRAAGRQPHVQSRWLLGWGWGCGQRPARGARPR